MPKLNIDCLDVLFKNFTEESTGAYLLYNCALLDKQWNLVATPYLYRDPWQHWIYRSKNNSVAKKLIDTYHLCYQVHSRKTSENNNRTTTGVQQHKRIRSIVNNNSIINNDFHLPRCDYISMAKNLHIPALYQCVEIWYKTTHGDETVDGEIEKYFLYFLKLFVDKARIKGCTFAESSMKPSYPIKLDHSEYLAITFNRLSVDLGYLNLGYFKCTDEALSIISKNCTSLKTFKIMARSCSDGALANFISSQKKLTKLKIRYAPDLQQTLDKIRSQAKTIVKLRILNCNLENCIIPFTGIAECINLRSIYMRNIERFSPNISISQLLMPIAKNCEFHNVDFTKTSLPVDVLVEIAKKSATTLRRVHLTRPTHLREEGIADENLSDGIMALANNATNLCVFDRNILPEELNAACYLVNTIGKSLTRLEIESIEMTDYDSSDLLMCIGNKCPYLTILNISNYEFSVDAFITLLNGCRFMHSLSMMFSDSVNDGILELIANFWSGTLKNLEIDECHNVTIEAVKKLRQGLDIDIDIETEENDE